MARPTKYKPEFAKQLPSMFDNGESVVEVCVALGIRKDTFYNWCKKYPKFSDAYKEGLERSEAWWQRLGRAGALGSQKINPTTWIFNMKNRFKWTDRTEVSQTGDVTIREDKTEKIKALTDEQLLKLESTLNEVGL